MTLYCILTRTQVKRLTSDVNLIREAVRGKPAPKFWYLAVHVPYVVDALAWPTYNIMSVIGGTIVISVCVCVCLH